MSEPRQPDDLDRELDDFLAGRSEVSKAYRADAAEQAAPTALDARVIAAAAAPLAQARRLQRWRLPVTLAASLVLVVGVLRLAVNEPVLREPALPSSSALSTVSEAQPGPLPQQMVGNAPEAAAEPESPAAASAPQLPMRAEVPAAAAKNAAADQQTVDAAADTAGNREVALAQRQTALERAEQSKVEAETRQRLSEPRPSTSKPQPRSSGSPASPPPPESPAAAGFAPPPAAASVVVPAPLSLPSAEVVSKDSATDAAPAAKASKTGPDTEPRLQARATSSGMLLKRSSISLSDPGWHAGQYQGLALGRATLDDVLRRFGSAPVAEQTRSAVTLPDGRSRHRLLEYPDHVDVRGPVRLYFDANSQALASVAVTLRPAMRLAAVETQEALTPPVRIRAAEAPLCTTGNVVPLPGAAGYPQYRVYPLQGVYLLLTTADSVSEISYFEVCN